ncbi:DUF1289 domain-containing protein [Marivivens donghaensis]|uniref:DUF1289 domain-containing protein n=1 Tax=Marivivens donghaensis TaxID=1699413 RepID=A0ABX0W0W2_9RHOB|nr:DUF1289 domain-containing protein [Marivivens donghaensis]
MNKPHNTDHIWKRAEIESPCVKLCSIHPETKTCVGCKRTMEEIGNWSRYTPEKRREIMTELPQRNQELKQRRGGRAARLSL